MDPHIHSDICLNFLFLWKASVNKCALMPLLQTPESPRISDMTAQQSLIVLAHLMTFSEKRKKLLTSAVYKLLIFQFFKGIDLLLVLGVTKCNRPEHLKISIFWGASKIELRFRNWSNVLCSLGPRENPCSSILNEL